VIFEIVLEVCCGFLRRLRLVWDDLGEVLICTFEFGCVCLKRWFGMQLIFLHLVYCCLIGFGSLGLTI